MKGRRIRKKEEADLDITSFMNLMIVLVPVLLLNMVFSHITVLDLNLPGTGLVDSPNDKENKQLELMISPDALTLYYPSGVQIANIAKKEGKYDFEKLTTYLKDVKQQLQQRGEDKKDIVLLSTPNMDYQTIITAMDTVRSYKAVQVADVVDAELFPDVSLGDAPIIGELSTVSDSPTAGDSGATQESSK